MASSFLFWIYVSASTLSHSGAAAAIVAALEGLPGQIVEGIHFVCPFGNHTEPCATQLARQRPQAGDAKLDFDFLV